MCGITGLYNLTSTTPIPHELLEKMIGMLHHRGSDGVGFYKREQVGLAHARLSIIDIEGGNQPVYNEDKTVWVIFNGEIFNYIELRKDLEKKGHVFYTRSDTEVIVHLYEEYGHDFVQYLNGQFAIALWDEKKDKLLLVRDRVGIHPLFYTEKDGRLIFASEIKAILPACNEKPGLNISALDQLMTFWSPVSPNTMFEGVYEVPPGQMMVVHNGKINKHHYWDWKFPVDGVYQAGSEETLAGELHDLLIDATRIRLRSDVPVGAYLSGGLDSSVLVSIIDHYGNVPLRTFSIGFDDNSLDESSYQKELIQHLQTDHSSIRCGYSDVADQFVNAIWHTEAPILRTAPVPMGILSGLVNDQGYKVVLTGEGADEVLGGYDIFKEAKIRQFWAQQPESKIRPLLLKRLYPYLNLSQAQSQAYLQNFFGAGIDQPETSYFSHIPRWTTTAKCKEFFSDNVKQQLANNAIETIAGSFPKAMGKWHTFNRSQYIEAKSLMAGYLLCSQGDRMLMQHSVEGRFPFLDHRVIEFANTLHPKIKMKVLNEKYLLKKAMGKYLPRSIVKRYKQPYRAPDIPAFFNTKVPDYVQELLSENILTRYGYFDAGRVSRLVKKIKAGRAIGYKDNMALVGVLSTQVWHYHFVENYEKNFGNPLNMGLEIKSDYVMGA